VTDSPFIITPYYDALGIRSRGSYQQEIRIGLADLSALVTDIMKALPRDAHGAAVIDQIIGAARASRPRDRTNAERQRRFRQRRRARRLNVCTVGKESAPA
jgi:hypothetical protein